MARAMVTRFGMSDELGPLAYAENQDEVFLGHTRRAAAEHVRKRPRRRSTRKSAASSTTAISARSEILSTRIDDLHTLAKGLLEYETLTGDEIMALLKGIPPVRTPYEEPEPQRGQGPSVPQAGRPRGIGPSRRSPSPVGDAARPQLLGISTSRRIPSPMADGYLAPDAALAQCACAGSDGADVIDLGCGVLQSGRKAVPPDVEIARLAPVVAALQARGAAVSIDSFSAAVQRWALATKCRLSQRHPRAFASRELYPALAASDAKLIVMHAVQQEGPARRADGDPGRPSSTGSCPSSTPACRAASAGIARDRLILGSRDGSFPGNRSGGLLRGSAAASGRLEVGVRSAGPGFRVAEILSADADRAGPAEAGAATLAAELFAAAQGADYIRTHDPGALCGRAPAGQERSAGVDRARAWVRRLRHAIVCFECR